MEIFLKELFNGEAIYQLRQVSTMRVNGAVFNDSTSIYKFKLTQLNSSFEVNDYIDIAYHLLETESSEISDIFSDMNEIVRKVMSLKDNLELRVNRFGKIVQILNRDALQKKWVGIKNELENDKVFSNLSDQHREVILSAGDKELSDNYDMESDLNNSTIFGTLFYDFSGLDLEEEQKSAKTIQKIKSAVLPEMRFQACAAYYLEDSVGRNFCISGSEKLDRDMFDVNLYKKFIGESYKDFIKIEISPFGYSRKIDYQVDCELGEVVSAETFSREQIGEQIDMIISCSLKKITNEQ